VANDDATVESPVAHSQKLPSLHGWGCLKEPSKVKFVATPSVQKVVGGHGFGRKFSSFNSIPAFADALRMAATSMIARGSREIVFSRQ
tara:strand:- start:127 stop:390 length:264 start_codon:yes stop_codon:yes gene_type:complete